VATGNSSRLRYCRQALLFIYRYSQASAARPNERAHAHFADGSIKVDLKRFLSSKLADKKRGQILPTKTVDKSCRQKRATNAYISTSFPRECPTISFSMEMTTVQSTTRPTGNSSTVQYSTVQYSRLSICYRTVVGPRLVSGNYINRDTSFYFNCTEESFNYVLLCGPIASELRTIT
jgi:hypothetical protein